MTTILNFLLNVFMLLLVIALAMGAALLVVSAMTGWGWLK
jgi:hypothetical protein